MNIEQLRAELERIRSARPASEGWSCKQIAAALKVGPQKAREIVNEAIDAGVLVRSTYYSTSKITGVTRPHVGVMLATKTTGTKKTKRS